MASACQDIGRDPDELVHSVALVACVGRDEADVARRAAIIGREVDDLRAVGLVGSPSEVVDRIGSRRERTGISRVYLHIVDLSDLEHVELIATDVATQLG